jgi:MFS family permease
MAVSQFIVGGVADAFGRMIPIIASLSLFTVAGAACAPARDLTLLSVDDSDWSADLSSN